MVFSSSRSARSTRLAVVILAGCAAAVILPGRYQSAHDTVAAASRDGPKDTRCELATVPCQQHGATISLGTDRVQAMYPTAITVNWPALSSSMPLELMLEGQEMAMGTYKLLLSKQVSGEYQAVIMLPVCTTKEMTWIGTITADSSAGQPPLSVSLRMGK